MSVLYIYMYFNTIFIIVLIYKFDLNWDPKCQLTAKILRAQEINWF